MSDRSLSCNCDKEGDRLVLDGSFLSCCCLLVLEKSVDGLADSAFPVAYILLCHLFWSSCSNAHVAPLEHEPKCVHCPEISYLSAFRGGNDWDCCVFYATSLFLRYKSFLLLTFKSVCDQCLLHVFDSWTLFCEPDPKMVHFSYFFEVETFQENHLKYNFHGHRCLFPSLVDHLQTVAAQLHVQQVVHASGFAVYVVDLEEGRRA